MSLSEPHSNELYGSRVAIYIYVCMYVCSYIMSCSYVHLWYVQPLTKQTLVHLGLGVPSQCWVPKWSSTEMAAIKYGLNIHHRQLQMSTEAPNYPPHNNRGSEKEDTGNYSPSKVETFTSPRSLQSCIHSSFLSLFLLYPTHLLIP